MHDSSLTPDRNNNDNNDTSKAGVAWDAVYFELFDEDTARVAADRSGRATWAYLGAQQHTVEHADEICPFVQILDAPVLLMGEQLVNFFSLLDTQSPVEQVIDVPKITQDRIQQRLVDPDLRLAQMAEQLVEVPTILTLAVLAEQIVDIPVPRGRGRWRRSSRPGEGSTAPSQQIVDTPVPRGGLQGFRQGQVLALHLQFLALRIERFMDFFSHFSRSEKKVRGPFFSCRGRRGAQLMDAGGL